MHRHIYGCFIRHCVPCDTTTLRTISIVYFAHNVREVNPKTRKDECKMSNPQIISIANQKGGVGKTTTALNIAAGLVKVEKKVLLIDLDPQSNLSHYLGFEPDEKPTISDLMSAAVTNTKVDIAECIRTSRENIDYIPSNINLSSADFFLITAMNREQILKKVLNCEATMAYDYIIVDCLPSLGILLINALAASDKVIIPVQAQKFALDGLCLLLDIYRMVKGNINPGLEIGGVLLTMSDNTNMSKAVEAELKNQFKEKMFTTKISRSVEATNSTYAQKSLISSKSSKLGKEYMQVTTELLARS